MMKPCCLSTEEKSKGECLPEDDGEVIVGGAVGWDDTCPSTADDAAALIAAAREKEDSALITAGGVKAVRRNEKKRKFR